MPSYKKVKTFTAGIPAGTGPVLLTAEGAVEEMLRDLHERMTDNNKPDEEELQAAVQLIVNGLGVNDWIDGEYVFFEDYKLRVQTMPEYRFEELPEFPGY